MALCLGGTISELQSKMSMREVAIWSSYRAKNGPLNDIRRYDRPAALLANILMKTHGGNTKMSDFMPFGIEEKQAEVNDLIKAFGGVKIAKRR